MQAAERPRDVKTHAIVNRRPFREYQWPEGMRRCVTAEFAYEQTPETILARIKELFPEGVDGQFPSLRTIGDWKYAARREWDEQRLAVVSKTLQRSSNRIVPHAVAGMYEGFLDALDALRAMSGPSGDMKLRLQAQRNVGDLGEKLLNQFRGGPAQGESAVDITLEQVQLIAAQKLVNEGKAATLAEALDMFNRLTGAYVDAALQVQDGQEAPAVAEGS